MSLTTKISKHTKFKYTREVCDAEFIIIDENITYDTDEIGNAFYTFSPNDLVIFKVLSPGKGNEQTVDCKYYDRANIIVNNSYNRDTCLNCLKKEVEENPIFGEKVPEKNVEIWSNKREVITEKCFK
jgi:hypothetical protein